ncbi:MAG TPA: helix-turn-helix domain-containing protein [Ilumatobacter sp.]|jgi:DNA-binding HxlR family transcriptional regulator|nr:helix-turn-helix domain-containing protein [Ilumatobacter sp.]
MPDYGNYCPIAIATDVIADRWTPLILRELVLGNTRFNDIARGLPGISRSLLVQRLKHLERKGVIETWPLPNGRGSEYHLTPAGRDLEPVLIVMGRWSVAWMYSNLDSTDVDAVTLMWWMHRRVDVSRLPHDRVVIQFDHTAPKRCSFWVVIEQGAASVCLQDPGYTVDAVVTCTTPALARVFSGVDTWREAVDAGAISVSGPRALVNAMPRWFLWSPWADDMRSVSESFAAP